ncbi:MAG: squalene--hopene cyclase [Candidatus Nitronauta litoralis]|uniref:Squalene--hopene cyclase n=1 Tax=Candidatus Nitronauta litoralis TaxID=2705533 RepID=A0A7T0G0I5_9BACT|nr:MAG: squalene--hopene cyclase [Candidatus Nitronauta litoralis]
MESTEEPTTPDTELNQDLDSPLENLQQNSTALDNTIAAARDYHFSTQYKEGYWVEELESNATITAEFVFLMHFLGIEDRYRDRREKIRNFLLQNQREHGGWDLFYGGPPDISATIEAYIALKMLDVSPHDPAMAKARKVIEDLGGVRSARVFTKIFLAMLGQSSWDDTPVMPVELILLPNWFYFNVYEMSSWSRGTVVPLTMVYAHKPVWPLSEEHSVPELFTPADRDLSVKSTKPGLNWPNTFLFIDKTLKTLGKLGWKPLRKAAMKKALRWTLDHQEPEGDFSGIQPAMFNSILALHLQGYSLDNPIMVRAFEAVDRFLIDREDHTLLQACVSPLWDTAIAANALMDSGVQEDHPSIVQACDWMLTKQVTRRGDWRFKNPGTPAGGWAFEFFNESYPDCDDTAEILMALDRAKLQDEKYKQREMDRALNWLFSMQSTNGGWAAFDRDNDHELFNEIPFADHGAMLDPPTVDVTGRILWMLGRIGHPTDEPRVRQAIDFIYSEQEHDGCWWGRWGVNYIYGTWLVLMGLRSIGEDMTQPRIKKASDWIKSKQNEDGGWGETCDSYIDPKLRGQGHSTCSQTAWALMGLIETGEAGSNAATKGVQYLIDQQQEDGSWYEDYFTGTGFPGHFYIRYHMYRQFFPLMALSRYRTALQSQT